MKIRIGNFEFEGSFEDFAKLAELCPRMLGMLRSRKLTNKEIQEVNEAFFEFLQKKKLLKEFKEFEVSRQPPQRFRY